MGPEFLTAIEARTALETPQIVLTWTFDDTLTTPLSSLRWLWDNMIIRRSEFRYPEDPTDGDSVLSEAYSDSPSTSYADTSMEALDNYYYSLFLQYTEHSASTVDLDQDVERLGSALYSICPYERTVLLSGVDGVTNGTTSFVSSGSTFLTDGIEAGFYLEIDDGGADDGFYRIVSVDSEISLTLDRAPSLSTTGVDFNIYRDAQKFWIAGISYDRKPTIWRWNSESQFVDFKIDLSEIMDLDEFPRSISYNAGLAIITEKRYLRIPINLTEPTDADIIVEWNLIDAALTGGYEIAGSFLDDTFEGSLTLFVLDSSNREIAKLLESNGSYVGTVDLDGLEDVTALKGLAPDYTNSHLLIGNSNFVYSVTEGIASPGPDDVNKVTYLREILIADIGYYEDGFDSDAPRVCIVNDVIDRVRSYGIEVGRAYLWQQPYVADTNCVALYHLEESSGDFIDAGPNGNDGANNSMGYQASGRFTYGCEADGLTDNIDMTDSGGNTFDTDFNGALGTLEFWFKASDSTILSSGNHILADIRVDVNNLVRISIASGQLTFQYIAGGTAITIAASHPSVDSEFHYYMISWSATADQVKAYVDYTQFGTTQTGLGTWAGTVASAYIGYTATSAVGIYDEVRVSDVVRINSARVQSYTDANTMWAYSGRDYDATYDDDDPLGFHYRDEYFTEKFMGGEFLIRNDYDKQQLYPPNKVIEDSEIIFRGPSPLPTLGHTGRLSRLLGLMIDRVADSREAMLDYIDRYKTDVESMPSQSDFLGIPGADFDNWNVDMLQRYMRLMPPILKRGGRSISYVEYAYLLGFIPVSDHLQARRRWDSVHYNANFDSRVQAIPLDTMGSCDTGDEYFPLALLRWRFYKRSVKSTGATSVAANRLLTDTSANFRDTTEIGAMVKVNDKDDNRDNGEYYITEIHSDTVLKINQDWPQGSLSSLSYTVNWEVPFPDPYIDYLLERFRDLAPQCMKTMHRDGTL